MITYKHVPLGQIQNQIETIGYEYVSGEHKGANSKITLKCKTHGDFKKTWYSINKLHQGCPKCAKASQKKTKETIIQEVENLGYNKVQEGSYDYSYVDKNKRQSKQSNKKKNLLAKGASGTMKDNTEREMAISLDLWRIWDCGKRKWEIKIK